MAKSFHFEVGDSVNLSVDEIWPDGDAPEDPTVEDVLEVVRRVGAYDLQREWGFDFHVAVDGREAF